MASANLMIAHELNPLKGWPSPYAVDKTLQVNLNTGTGGMVLSDALTYFVAGKVATQSAAGTLNLGTQVQAAGICPMPIYIFPNAKDFDVMGDDGNIVGMNTNLNGTKINFAYTGGGTSPFVQAPLVTGLVASGSYELETTEWVASDAANLIPGRLVSSAAFSGSNQLTAGQLISATIAKNNVVCGVVSDGLITSEFIDAPASSAQRLRFWPCFLPIWSVA